MEGYRPEVPYGLAEIIHTALAMDPHDRFWNMHEMKAALNEVLQVV